MASSLGSTAGSTAAHRNARSGQSSAFRTSRRRPRSDSAINRSAYPPVFQRIGRLVGGSSRLSGSEGTHVNADVLDWEMNAARKSVHRVA